MHGERHRFQGTPLAAAAMSMRKISGDNSKRSLDTTWRIASFWCRVRSWHMSNFAGDRVIHDVDRPSGRRG